MDIDKEVSAIITSVLIIAFLAIVFNLFTAYKSAKEDSKKAEDKALDI